MREIPLELLGLHGTDPFYGTTHAARGAMYASQVGQAPVVEGSEPQRILTGLELRLGEHIFDVKFPKDVVILNVIRKYPMGYGNDSIKHNPVTTIIYEDYYDVNKTIGMIHVPEYMSFHQEFGFELKKNKETFGDLVAGAMIPKDTVLASSNTVSKNGLYGIGVNANVLFRSSPGTIEDGFIFSQEFLEEKMSPRTYTQAIGGCGKRAFFLNLYGDDKIYKPFPDIGERIREDGVIFAVRDLDDNLSPAEMTPRALREFDRTFDRGVIGEPGSIVKDINVFWDDKQNPTFVPSGMDTHLRKYYEALKTYHSEVLKIYKGLSIRRKDKLRCTPEFHQLVVEAIMFLPQDPKKRKLTRMYRLEQLDEWRVEITYETKRIPSNAYKFADTKGGQSVH